MKADAVRIAKQYVRSIEPPLNLNGYQEPVAVYAKEENAWIVWFSDKRPIPPPDSDFMIKIDALSGNSMGFLGGANKGKYYKYFSAASEMSPHRP